MKLFSTRDKRRTPEDTTMEIFTFEGLFTFIKESKARIKEKRNTDFDFDIHSLGGVDIGVDGSGCRSGGSDEVSLSSEPSTSPTAIVDDNPGTGRFLYKHVYQPVSRFTERTLLSIMLLLHVGRGGGTVVPLPAPGYDSVSLEVSETSIMTDNPGTGRILDKYIYCILGRMLERCSGRILMSTYLSAFSILRRIEEVWYNVEIKEPCFVCRHLSVHPMSIAEKIRMAVSRIEDAPSGNFILSGVKEITKRLR